ncbi:MAG: hypothetical protein RIS76_3868 [Verrucomicrobiota bacterium]|jgi:hypothetical protein
MGDEFLKCPEFRWLLLLGRWNGLLERVLLSVLIRVHPRHPWSFLGSACSVVRSRCRLVVVPDGKLSEYRRNEVSGRGLHARTLVS